MELCFNRSRLTRPGVAGLMGSTPAEVGLIENVFEHVTEMAKAWSVHLGQ